MNPGASRDDMARPLARSYLYVPGDQPRFLDKARGRGADAVIVDLEDGVAHSNKDLARATTAVWLSRQGAGPGEIWIRISGAGAEADLELARFPCVRGVMLPKAQVETMRSLDPALARQEAAADRASPLQVIALIETAAGLESVASIAAMPRILRFGIGKADLLADLGIVPGLVADADLTALWLRIVVASAASGIDAPIAPVETMVRHGPDGASAAQQLESTTRRFFALGFRARTAVHPNQVDTINNVFTPTPAEIDAAREQVEWFDRAVRSGAGVVVDGQGAIVDEAVIRVARETLRRARQAR